MKKIKIIKVGNHWYLAINHPRNFLFGFDEKIDKYLTIKDKRERLTYGTFTIEFEETGVVLEGTNILYFNEQDIVRYLTTDDEFDLRFSIDNHDFTVNSNLYWLLEDQLNLNFHKTIYKVHIF